MSEEKKHEQQQRDRDRSKVDPDAEVGEAATREEVEQEEKSGGALPSNHPDD